MLALFLSLSFALFVVGIAGLLQTKGLEREARNDLRHFHRQRGKGGKP